MSSLVVWLKDQTIGELSRSSRGQLRFQYSESVRAELAGAPVLSVSMPVRNQPYVGAVPAAYFEGLLPEGEARRMIAYDLRLDPESTYGLLAALGRDCAGAVCLLVPGEVPDAALAGARPVAEAEVARRLRDLPVNPLGVDRQIRVSLAGMQAKLLVTRTPGGWALPGTTPSTHILKPESPVWTSSVANESFCLEVARRAGLAVTEAEVRRFEDVLVLAVKRYDRVVEAGAVARIHQEDFAQSLGLTPGRKYQGTGGASLADCARVLDRWSRVDDRLGLLDMVAVSLAVGNADLHAKNLSLLHGPDHSVRLAPVYDLMSTAYYPRASQEAAMAVNGRSGLGDIGWEDLVEEAVAWGLPRRVVTGRMSELADRLPAAVQVAAELTNPPGALADFVISNVARLGAAWASAPSGRGGGAPSAAAGGGESEEAAPVSVRSYRRADGTVVRGHPRRSPGPRKRL